MKWLVVVEDNEEMRLLVTRALRKDDRITVRAWGASAAEAVAEAERAQPDLVVLDHFIHGDVYGLAAASMVKAVAPNAKILLFSDHDLSTEASREPSVDAFLPKDRIRELLPTICGLLELD